MNPPVAADLAAHIDRITRRSSTFRGDFVVRDVANGWLRAKPAAVEGEFPSASNNRMHWMVLDGVVTEEKVREAVQAFREFGCSRAFFWSRPEAWSVWSEDRWREHGLMVWPYVQYLAFVAPAGLPPVRAGASAVTARPLTASEVPSVLAAVQPWNADGQAAARMQADSGTAEMHAAFEDGKPIAVAALVKDDVDPRFAYLGWAWTHAECRRRGAQTAIIASRMARARELGAVWCVSETNTMVEQSLRNLERAGFATAMEWRVLRWDEAKR